MNYEVCGHGFQWEDRCPGCFLWGKLWNFGGWIFDKPMRDYVFSSYDREYNELRPWQVWWCRLHGHPAGTVFYSAGYAPDMHCSYCGDDLG